MQSSSSLENEMYSFIDKTINVLLVDRHYEEMAGCFQMLSFIKMFNVIAVTTAHEAAPILKNTHVHVCIMELSVDDIHNDAFYLPKQFNRNTHFLSVTGEQSCSKGFMAIKNGILDVVDKPVNIGEVCKKVFHYAIRNILNPVLMINQNTLLDRSVSLLMEKSPRSVSEWANEMNIATCTLREIWQRREITPKIALYIWNLYNNAFVFYYNQLFTKKISNQNMYTHIRFIRKMRDMFYCKRSTWLGVIDATGSNRVLHRESLTPHGYVNPIYA